MDDGVEAVEDEERNAWSVFVVVSDAAKAVRPGSREDVEARRRGATSYRRDWSVPMLPRGLSEGKLSLLEGEERDVLCVHMLLSRDDLSVMSTSVSLKSSKSAARLSYEDVPRLMSAPWDSGDSTTIVMGKVVLPSLKKLAMGLLARRRAAGAMVAYDVNNGWVTTEEGSLKKLESKEETVGHVIVQELMVLANQALASYCVENGVPVIFRNHEARPAADRVELMRQIDEAFLTPVSDLSALQHRAHLLLGRAEYGSKVLGHFGLNAPVYGHFTSPIRRYADLFNHQQLRAHILGEAIPRSAKDADEVASEMNEIARAVREGTRSHYVGAAEERAGRKAGKVGLESLPERDFERLFKAEIRAGGPPSPEMAAATSARLAAGKVPLSCLTEVLVVRCPDGWEGLREESLLSLYERPEDAVSVLSQASQTVWGTAEYEVEKSGTPHSPSFRVVGTLEVRQHGTTYRAEVSWRSGGSARAAKQRAAFLLLGLAAMRKDVSAVVEVGDAVAGGPPSSPEAVVVPPRRPEVDLSKHPVSALMEMSQVMRTPPPAFSFSSSGPPHSPTVACEVTFQGVTKSASGPSKQSAKTEASRLLVELLHLERRVTG